MAGTEQDERSMGMLARIAKLCCGIAGYRVATLLAPLWSKNARRPPTERLRAYFLDPANYADRTFREVREAAGPWDRGAELDRGLGEYIWERRGLKIQVFTRDGMVEEVRCTEIHARDPSLQTIWIRPPETTEK